MKAAEKGDYVIVEYKGEIYPGKVMDRTSNGVLVNVMSKCEGQGWKWPMSVDQLFYNWIDVKRIMNPSNITPLNNRGIFRVFEMESK